MSVRPPLDLAILISGRGSNMAAIARACREGHLNARVRLVLSDRPDAAGLQVAHGLGIGVRTVAWRGPSARAAFERELEQALETAQPQLLVLAGFMRVLSRRFVAARAGSIVNIHPSLLPNYPGLHTHERVLAAGERDHGATVHFVTAELDAGPAVLQSKIAVHAGESAERLSARVQATEHIIYPRVIGWLADGRLTWREDRPWLDGRPLLEPIVEEFGEDNRN